MENTNKNDKKHVESNENSCNSELFTVASESLDKSVGEDFKKKDPTKEEWEKMVGEAKE